MTRPLLAPGTPMRYCSISPRGARYRLQQGGRLLGRSRRLRARLISRDDFPGATNSINATRKGEISDAEFFAALRALLGVELSDAQFWKDGTRSSRGEMPGIAELLARAAQRLPL